MNNKSQTVNLTIPSELLKKVDALAKRDYTSRSDILRQALLEKIRSEQAPLTCISCAKRLAISKN